MATPEEMQASMIANLPEKTGRSLEEWVELVRGSGHEKHGQMVKFLKDEHGLSHGYANLVAHVRRDPAILERSEEEDLVEAQYSGKDDLRPIYEKIIAAVAAFGDDVELAPKKAYVSLRRSKQFGLVQPSTKTRVDVGIKSGSLGTGGRLEPAGSFNSMMSHRVRVSSPEDVDDELLAWLRTAYEEA